MKLGIDKIDNYNYLFEGKRVGLITNPTGINSNFSSTIDVLNLKANLVALFSPEHGVRGNIQAGVRFDTYVDDITQIKVYSLYNEEKRPSDEMMNELDLLCIDIQDAGSRFYTYIYTMAYSMMACKENNKKFVVFDRPNPINGITVEGNILDLEYRSFIGYYPIVQRHGMTIGEIAYLFNYEYGIDCDLIIIKMDDWKREMDYRDTNLLWVMPSPNFPTPETAYVFNGTCIFEGTNLSEGRGTTVPFEVVGAPFVNPFDLSSKLNTYGFEGVYFRPLYFTPTFSKHAGKMCGGVQLHILDREKFTPVKVGWTMLQVIRNMYPYDFKVLPPYKEGRPCMLELNTGSGYFTKEYHNLESLYDILKNDTEKFKKIREKYLIY